MKKKEMLKHINHLDGMVGYCVDYMDAKGLLEEHFLIFPDGEIVWAAKRITNENK
jgi:hypothetical protein